MMQLVVEKGTSPVIRESSAEMRRYLRKLLAVSHSQKGPEMHQSQMSCQQLEHQDLQDASASLLKRFARKRGVLVSLP